MLRIDTADIPWVLSRYEPTEDLRAPSQQSSQLNPVGIAAAKGGGSGGGRGAAGRGSGGYSSAPETNHGWAWWHGGDYTDDWYEAHADVVEKYDVTIVAVGVAYLGLTNEYKDDRPDAGPVPWDQKYEPPNGIIEYPIENLGWYRVGIHITGKTVKYDFSWEAVDFEVVPDGNGYELTNEWKISPRI